MLTWFLLVSSYCAGCRRPLAYQNMKECLVQMSDEFYARVEHFLANQDSIWHAEQAFAENQVCSRHS